MNRTQRRLGSFGLALLAIAAPACALQNAEDGEAAGKDQSAFAWHVDPLPTYTFEPAPPPPPPLGWPHTIMTATFVDCATNPAPNQVIVASGHNFTGSCAALTPGFYPFPANLLVGNDTVTSIKVGSAVRARLFAGARYQGSWAYYPPGTVNNRIELYNAATSMRVEPGDRSPICDDLRVGEIALFENSNFQGDCVVLPGDTSYATVDAMGIEDNSISSIRNNSSRRLIAFWHQRFDTKGFEVAPLSSAASLPSGGWFTDGINDDISSIQMVQ